MVDLARLIGKALADILGVGANRLNHFPELAHHLASFRDPSPEAVRAASRETATAGAIRALPILPRTTHRTFNQSISLAGQNPRSRKTIPRTRGPCRNAD
jgi:hypothetical protein